MKLSERFDRRYQQTPATAPPIPGTEPQTPVTGSGTSQDPYKVITVNNAGGTGLVLTETDTYVVGQESYTTSVKVDNTSETSFSLILYRAGDCFLGGSDEGTGGVSGSSIACVQQETGRIEEWVPITSGRHTAANAKV